MSESPKRCETLPDPLDPCCSITVCDEETPDVMKANITGEEADFTPYSYVFLCTVLMPQVTCVQYYVGDFCTD